MSAMLTRDFSLMVGTTAAQAYAELQSQMPADPGSVEPLTFLRLYNVAASGGGTIWFSRTGTAAVGAPGSVPLAPGQSESWNTPQYIPLNALSVIATAANTPLTIEVG